MSDQHKTIHLHWARPSWIMLLPIVLFGAMLACELPFGSDQSLQETVNAMSVQSTMIAESTNAALQFQGTLMAGQATQFAQQAAATQDLLTSPGTEAPVAPAVTPSPSEVPPVIIIDWSTAGWTLSKSDECHKPGDMCWIGPNYKEKCSLTSKTSVFIDPAWPRPHLVYWNRYYSEQTGNFGYIEFDVEGQAGWDRRKKIGGTDDQWHQGYVDLKDFSGKNISVRFFFEPDTRTGDLTYIYIRRTWYLQDVQVVPDYSAP